MEPKDAALLVDAAREWRRRGLLSKTSLAKLESELLPIAAPGTADKPLAARDAALVLQEVRGWARRGLVPWSSMGPIEMELRPAAKAWDGPEPSVLYPRESALVLREARKWNVQGLLPPTTLPQLELEYGEQAAPVEKADRRIDRAAERVGVGATVLYALAGILLGAAAIALVLLGHLPLLGEADWMRIEAVAFLAGGFAAWRMNRAAGIVDAFLVATMLPLTVSTFLTGSVWLGPDTQRILGIASLGILLAMPWPRRTWKVVPGLSVAAVAFVSFRVALLFSGSATKDLEPLAWVWLSILAVAAVSHVVGGRMAGRSWRILTVPMLLCVAVIPCAILLSTTLALGSELVDLWIGAGAIAVLGLGLALREPSLVLGGGFILGADAIVYAFTAGGLGVGVTVLLGLALALVLVATRLRKWARPARAWMTLHSVPIRE